MTTSLLDTALDLSVVGGYTNVGYRGRSRGWSVLPRMEGKVVFITGATSGIGLAAADGFARLGATVWLAVRNRERGEDARAKSPNIGEERSADSSRSWAVRARAQRPSRIVNAVHAMHPGWDDTAGVKSSLPRFYRVTRPLLGSRAPAAVGRVGGPEFDPFQR